VKSLKQIDKNSKLVLLYDGECKFCNFWITLIQRQKAQNKFRYYALQSDEGKELQSKFSIPQSVDSVLVIKNETVFFKSNAALEVANTLGGKWKFALVFWLMPKPIRDWLYDLVAKNRHRIFRNRQNCELHY
jgi:predicted DCC family thiol-disulfide oxidoreductase YuxK